MPAAVFRTLRQSPELNIQSAWAWYFERMLLMGLFARVRLRFKLHHIHRGLRFPAALAVFCHDVGEDAAAHVKFGSEAHEAWLGRSN